MIGPTSRKNWLTFDSDPVPYTDSGSLFHCVAIAERGILGDLLPLLIQSLPDFTMFGEMTDIDKRMNPLYFYILGAIRQTPNPNPDEPFNGHIKTTEQYSDW